MREVGSRLAHSRHGMSSWVATLEFSAPGRALCKAALACPSPESCPASIATVCSGWRSTAPSYSSLRFICCDRLVAGFASGGVRTCWAHNDKTATFAVLSFFLKSMSGLPLCDRCNVTAALLVHDCTAATASLRDGREVCAPAGSSRRLWKGWHGRCRRGFSSKESSCGLPDQAQETLLESRDGELANAP
jgi:hypothetical protein